VEGGEEVVAERGLFWVVVLRGRAAPALCPEEVEVAFGVVGEAEGGGGEDVEDDGELGVEVAEGGGEVWPPEQRPGAAGGGE